MIVLLAAESAMGKVLEASASPYPPSFDNNPIVFGWALFARMLVLLLSAATLLRLRSRSLREKIPANHPVYYHRMVTSCFLTGALMASLSDVLTYLFWGEASSATTAIVLFLSRMLDGLTMFPFLMAMFVPFWLRWLCRIGILRSAPSITLNGVVNDVRTTWDSGAVPLRLAVYAAAGSAMVTVGKYWLWLDHGHR